MTGIVFPNVVGTLAPLMQLEQNEQRNAFEMARIKKADAAEARDLETGQHFGAALKGDPDAIAKVASNPKYALPLAQFLERADTNQRAKLKDQLETTGKAAAGILALPEADQPAAYEAVYQNLTAQGHKLNLPPRWSPALKGQLQSYAVQVPEYLKMLEGQPQPMGGAPSGPPAVATPDVKAKGAEYSNYLQTKHGLSPVAAAGIVGGLVQESGLDPGYGFTRPGGDNGTAHGMGQWRLDRAQGLQKFAQAQGKPPTDPTTQLDYLVTEMKGGDMGAQRAYAMLQQAKTPEEATTAMMHFFRPAGYTPNNPQGGHGYTQRVQYAQQFAPTVANGLSPANMPPVGTSPGVSPPGQTFAGMPPISPSGAPPGMAVGDTQPRADASGNALPPVNDALAPVRGIQLPPGARIMAIKGQPIIKEGTVQILKPDGQVDFIPLPTRAPPKERQVPAGYEENPNGGGLRPIVGGPADPVQAKAMADAKRKAEEKATPQSVAKGMQENLTALKKLDSALTSLDEPKAKGSVGGVGGYLASQFPGGADAMNYFDPDGTKVRALIADIGSLKIHDRSGAAVTAAETPRLKPFVPSIGDSPKVIKEKLNNFRVEYEGMLRDSLDFYSEANGFKPYTPALDYLNKGGQPAAAAPPTPAATPAPAQPAPNASPIAEGATATNPQTGQRVIFSGGKWIPTR